MIEFDCVTKVFGAGESSVRALRDLSFQCPAGGFWSIMGPSGSGKSTILHLIAGLTRASAGRVLVAGEDIGHKTAPELAALRRRRIGYVMQAFNLLPYLTAEENVGLPLVIDRVDEPEVQRRAREALAHVNMVHRAGHFPSPLSGGEQQRVAVARALVIKPAIILADEPTGNLDRTGGRAIIDLIQDLNEETGVTVLLVTHDPVFAASAQCVLRLLDGTLQREMGFVDDPAATREVAH